MKQRVRGVVDGWQRFWFAPRSTATLAIVRIAFGALTTLWFASLLPVLLPFFGADAALVARPRLATWTWTLMTFVGGRPVFVVLLWLVALLGAVALMVGYRTRLAAIVVLVGLVSFTRQMPLAINGGDLLLRTLSFYFVLAPAGAALSIDRWRTHRDRFWEYPAHAPWVLRLMQIQLSVVYISTVWEKAAGSTWRDGTALSFALRLDDIQRFPVPSFVTDTLWLSQLMTQGTLALELAIGVLVWNRVARPWVLGMGVLLHLSIDLTIAVGFFSFTMITLYLVFLAPRTTERLIEVVRVRVATRRAARHPSSPSSPGGTTGGHGAGRPSPPTEEDRSAVPGVRAEAVAGVADESGGREAGEESDKPEKQRLRTRAIATPPPDDPALRHPVSFTRTDQSASGRGPDGVTKQQPLVADESAK